MRGAAAAAAALALAAAGGVAACGGSGNDGAATTAIQAPAMTGAVPTTTTEQPSGGTIEVPMPRATTTTPTATTGTPPTGTRTATTPTGESGAGGAGDEEAIRTPVALTARDGALSPTTVTIPAFLALTVTVTSTDRSQIVRIDAPGGGTLAVPAGGKASKSLTGLRPGDYTVTTKSGGKTVLHVVNGGDPGP